jgi:outer membrane protein assembly factor BamE
MVSRLKPGMTRDQVRFIMGTPLVADIFHNDRWDYVYTRVPQRGGGSPEQRRLSVFFADDKLARLDGDVVAQKTP